MARHDGPFPAALKAANPIIDLRRRNEWKDQADVVENACANFPRTRFGFETGDFHRFQDYVEIEQIASIGGDRFISTTNERTQFPVFADPDAMENNRAQATFADRNIVRTSSHFQYWRIGGKNGGHATP